MESKTTTTQDRSQRKRTGLAIEGLKAWIKALEIAEGTRVSQRKYLYEIDQENQSARIIERATGSVVDGSDRSLADWASVGGPARHALIGLRYTKDQVERDGERVWYTMNIITGEAFLSHGGEPLADHPQTVDGWVEIAKPVEKREFDSLRAARDYNNHDAAEQVLASMIRWGIIHKPRDKKGAN